MESYFEIDDSDSTFIPLAKNVVNLINRYPLSHELSRQALKSVLKINQEDDIKYNHLLLFIIGEQDTTIPLHIGGSNLVETGIIILRYNRDIWKMFGILIFELLNIKNFDLNKERKIISILGNKKGSKTVREEKFATLMEHIECQSVKGHHEIMAQGIKEYGWPSYLDTAKKIENKVCQAKETPHKQAYRNLL